MLFLVCEFCYNRRNKHIHIERLTERDAGMPNKILNYLNLLMRSALFLYLPVVLLLSLLYQVVFGAAMRFDWLTSLGSLGVVVSWMYSRYKHSLEEEQLSDVNHLERTLNQNRWEIIDRRRDTIIVRPTFDLPFSLIIDDRVKIHYKEDTATINGALHYVTTLSETIREGSPIKKWKFRKVFGLIFSLVFIPLPFIRESGILWEVDVLKHNAAASEKAEAMLVEGEFQPNVENINNDGLGAEDTDHIFYVHGDSSVIKTDKDLNFEETLLRSNNLNTYRNINLTGDWLYLTNNETMRRMKTDGTKEEVLYDLGYISEVHVTEAGIYFINTVDHFNVYRMDLNGENLKRLMDVEAKDLAVYGDELFVSYDGVVERMNLDGTVNEVILNESVRDLVRHDGHYYYIGSDGKLYKRNENQASDTTVLVDRAVGTYTLTEDKVIYTLSSDNDIHPSHGIHETDHHGSPGERIYASNYVDNLTKVGDSILFRKTNSFGTMEMKRYDLKSGQVGEIYID